jgi:hypothetical protein
MIQWVGILLLFGSSAAYADWRDWRLNMSVTPTTACTISGPVGGPFTPSQCTYQIADHRRHASLNFQISSIPPWLTASSKSGTTPATVTFTVNQAYAAQQPASNYTETIALTNVTSGRGNTTRTATMIVTAPPPSAAPTVSLVANPASIQSGASSTLTWSSTNATGCVGANFTASGTSGSTSVSPTATTTYSISCQGPSGSTMRSASVTVTGGSAGGSATGTIPLSFNDPMFAGIVESGRIAIPNGGTLANTSVDDPNGDNVSIFAAGAATVNKCRVRSREALRVGGSGLVRIDKCWLEAKGISGDHADVIQAYAPGKTGTIHITNSSLRAYNNDATAGMFVADNWTGTVRLENVLVWGGPYGLRLHSDVGGDLHIYLKDVLFVGPFMWGPYLITGENGTRAIIEQWDNVRQATIVNGVLVPGALMPRPR